MYLDFHRTFHFAEKSIRRIYVDVGIQRLTPLTPMKLYWSSLSFRQLQLILTQTVQLHDMKIQVKF